MFFVIPCSSAKLATDTSSISIRRSGQSWGDKPRHIVIDGLELRNAAVPHGFTNSRGEKKTYLEHTACIFVERGEHITMARNDVHGCGNGLFVASNDSEAGKRRNRRTEISLVPNIDELVAVPQ